jgi:hypothetical protein
MLDSGPPEKACKSDEVLSEVRKGTSPFPWLHLSSSLLASKKEPSWTSWTVFNAAWAKLLCKSGLAFLISISTLVQTYPFRMMQHTTLLDFAFLARPLPLDRA